MEFNPMNDQETKEHENDADEIATLERQYTGAAE
jgi:hypothetical protein